MQGVTITITQDGVEISGSPLTTDDNGDAAITLNAGVYTLTFTYTGRAPHATQIIINHDNTYMVFAFPNLQTGAGGNLLSTGDFTQSGDVTIDQVSHIFTSTGTFDNSAP